VNGEYAAEVRSIAEEFEGWEAWCGLNSMWHARLVGSVPPLMVHGESPAEVREQIRQQVKARGQEPGGITGPLRAT
jgi:hypothetical protein